jgi:peptidoglycan hydrolase CwlO-like protein
MVDGHYRLHDLDSTNFTFVEGNQVTDFHLHQSCKITFGNVECEYDATAAENREMQLTPAQMEKDMAFLRAENQELLNKIDGLQRRVDILSSARLITGKTETGTLSAPDQVKKLTGERDELRFQVSGLKLELEKLRSEISATVRERDAARQANELLHAERAIAQEETQGREDKGATQRIFVPPHPAGDAHLPVSKTDSVEISTGTFGAVEARSK